MVTSNARDTYDWLLQAMQQKALQGRGGIFSAPNGVSGIDDDPYSLPQGGLLGRLTALQTGQGNTPTSSPVARPTLFEARDPNFRQLSRVVNRTQDAIGTSDQQEYPSEARRGQSTMSDAAPESIRAGAQYAQGPRVLSFEGPGGRAFDGNPAHDAPIRLFSPDPSEDVLASILGASLLAGATILESKRKGWPGKDRKDDSPSMRRNRRKWRTDALIRDMMGKAITSTSGADPGDPCDVRYREEEKRCIDNWLADARRLCIAHAVSRRDLCKRNGGKPDPTEKPEWSPEQEQ
jgi:hypothetical protein